MANHRLLPSRARHFGFSVVINALLICGSLALKSSDDFNKKEFSGVSVSKPRSELDLTVASSVAADYMVQSIAPRSSSSTAGQRYGYPYRIAPTLGPVISARSDDYENEASRTPTTSRAKSFGSRLRSSANDDIALKKGSQKKHKLTYTYGAVRRQGYDSDDSLPGKRLTSYREPKYRNFDELETMFRPRRIDIDVPYSAYQYSEKDPSVPAVSPRDPYLSPSDEPTDSFYPIPKVKSYSSTYGQSGQVIPAYGAGRYEDPHVHHNDHIHGSYAGDSYYGESPKYPSSDSHYNYQEDYTIESNKPIVGDIRKKLLDYAGASDLYEGEPDYLREVARNKQKYGNIGNDYYSYGGPEYRSSYRDFPYVESKMSIFKKSRT